MEGILIIYLGTVNTLDGLFTVGVFKAFLAYKSQFGSKVGSLVDQYVKILFLDEATSHFITKEKAINENLKALNITKIMVAHRKETIDSADRVVNLEMGFA